MSTQTVRADYKPALTIKDRRALWTRRAADKFNEAEHHRRTLKTEYVGGYVLGFFTGAGFATVVIALCLWWAPLGWAH